MIVLDTDILIALERSDAATLRWLQTMDDEDETLATTSLNVAEVLRGLSGRRGQRLRRLLRGLTEVPFGPRASRRYALIQQSLDRVGRRLPTVDAMIAAATLEAGCRLATGNVRHFDRVPGLDIVQP